MNAFVRVIVLLAMVLLASVSIWASYVSLRDSILPEPTLNLSVGPEGEWPCAVAALGIAAALGLMILALKVSLLDGFKPGRAAGVAGLIMLTAVSITFNVDVIYRLTDRDFYARFAADKLHSVYEPYLTGLTSGLDARRESAGAGGSAGNDRGLSSNSSERFTVLAAAEGVQAAARLLHTAAPATPEEAREIEKDLRSHTADAAALLAMPAPAATRTDSPLFAVISRMADFRSLGPREILALVISVFLDLGDVFAYGLVFAQRRKHPFEVDAVWPIPGGLGAEPQANWSEDRTELPGPGRARRSLPREQADDMPAGERLDIDHPGAADAGPASPRHSREARPMFLKSRKRGPISFR